VVDVKQTKPDNSMIPPRKSRISLLKIERPCEPDVEWGGIDWASVRFQTNYNRTPIKQLYTDSNRLEKRANRE
jgi:hypothetical protein